MMTRDKEFLDQVKQILTRIPGVQSINGFRHKILQIRELSSLIKENRIVFFPLCSGVENLAAMDRGIVHEVVKEWLDLYGMIRLRRATTAVIGSPARASVIRFPMALLEIPSIHDEYLKRVERETRRVIRLATKQGYEFREFNWNDHLEEIFDINVSKEVRQSEPMRGWYRESVQPRHHSKEEMQYRKYYGGFKDGRLYAYFHFYVCGDFAIGKHFLGHGQHLPHGIMNGLISWTVRECIENSQIRWINYGTWQKKGSLNSFKQRAGFQEYAVLLDLESDQELVKYSDGKVTSWWRI